MFKPKKILMPVLYAVLALTVISCAAAKGPGEQKTPPPAPIDGFLGHDAALMAPVPGHEPMRAWRSPEFNPKDYRAILLDKVVVWNKAALADRSGIAPEQLQALADYFEKALAKALADIKFPLVSAPGPGVLRISAAIEDVRPSNPVRNTITSVLPIGMILSLGEKAALGRDPNVGSCAIAMRFSDAGAGRTVGMFSDERQGDKYDSANFSETGQAEKAMNEWSALIQKRILTVWGAKKAGT